MLKMEHHNELLQSTSVKDQTCERIYTKSEAITLMQQGFKVRHHLFEPLEWIKISNASIITEDGYSCSIDDFFAFRSSEMWENGYTLVDTT